MSRLFLALCACLTLLLTGCPWATPGDLDEHDARLVANGAALSLEAATSTAELLYELEQRALIESALKEDGITKTKIRLRLDELRAKWDPVKKLIENARVLHAKLAAAADQGNRVTLVALASEYAAAEAMLAAAIAEARKRVTGG